MRWNCPHCGTALAMLTESTDRDWMYTRCYQCGGFSLVRPSRVDLMKLDENSEHFATRSQPITAQAPDYKSEPPTKIEIETDAAPEIEAAPRPEIRSISKIKRARHEEESQKFSAPPAPIAAEAPEEEEKPEPPSLEIGIPITEASTKPESGSRFLSSAISMLSVIAVGSGAYLLFQGKELWESTDTSLSSKPPESLSAFRSEMQKPVADKLIQEANAPKSEEKATPSNQKVHVTSNAAAVEAEYAKKNGLAARLPDRLKGESRRKKKKAKVEILRNRAAPKFTATSTILPKKLNARSEIKTLKPLTVTVRSRFANMRSGPGLKYPVVGYAKKGKRYRVVAWKGNWFRLKLNRKSRSAWVRNDLLVVQNQ